MSICLFLCSPVCQLSVIACLSFLLPVSFCLSACLCSEVSFCLPSCLSLFCVYLIICLFVSCLSLWLTFPVTLPLRKTASLSPCTLLSNLLFVTVCLPAPAFSSAHVSVCHPLNPHRLLFLLAALFTPVLLRSEQHIWVSEVMLWFYPRTETYGPTEKLLSLSLRAISCLKSKINSSLSLYLLYHCNSYGKGPSAQTPLFS